MKVIACSGTLDVSQGVEALDRRLHNDKHTPVVVVGYIIDDRPGGVLSKEYVIAVDSVYVGREAKAAIKQLDK